MKPRIKLNPDVFLFAAESLDVRRSSGACIHISDAASALGIEHSYQDNKYIDYFSRVLQPEGTCASSCWYRSGPLEETYEDTIRARIYGLLLCAVLVREGYQP